MIVKWTKEQQKVIDLRKRNILVSAAAGSGKTAVLVERIIKLITDVDNPLDVDRLLVVTFTKAAAAEMRERVGLAVEKKLESEPDNLHLQKQLTILHNAQITTIDSFCLYIIRNYFQKIDLNPDFRIADEGELKLLKSDVADEVLNEFYLESSKEFIDFIEAFSTGKTDSGIKDLILQMFEFSVSYPDPEKWIQEAYKSYDIENEEDLKNSEALEYIVHYIKTLLTEAEKKLNIALSIINESNGPYMYLDAIESDINFVKSATKCNGYEELYSCFNNIKFEKLSSKRDKNVDNLKKEQIKILRDSVKKKLNTIKEKMLCMDFPSIYEITIKCKPLAKMLSRLTKAFLEKFSEQKLEKNILDFSDLEHFALKILLDENGMPTSVAKDFSNHFEEILIDEYQDSNQVQDILLRSVSKEYLGINNVFMVGDVKQSIYKFRLARPELFIDKYNNYSVEDSSTQRIDLHKNFRSRFEVIDSINYIFFQIMNGDIGGVEYDNTSALYAGMEYKKAPRESNSETEVIFIDYNKDKIKDKKELEATAIGSRIKEITDKDRGIFITDKETGELRHAEYRDIVILLRTVTGWGEKFVDVLSEMGIPVHMQSSLGYFSTIEVKTILSFLSVIDNPMQDIPLTAVLKSPIAGLNSNELALIKSEYDIKGMFKTIKAASIEANENITDNLRNKINIFLELLEDMQRAAFYMPINELINYMFKKTGYINCISAMPGGSGRRANARMLVEKAAAFEKTSYKGLFNFIRYINQLIDYEVDFGEASTVDENDNTVKIMSIHKSKGLEFPIVFVSGMGKKFNRQDSMRRVILHPDMGIGMDYVDSDLRIKMPTLIKQAVTRKITIENVGEELRVLYVALTRAKEKLIMTGVVEELDKKISGNTDIIMSNDKNLGFDKIVDASSYMDWLIPSLIRHRAFKNLLEEQQINTPFINELYDDKSNFIIKRIDSTGLIIESDVNNIINRITKDRLLSHDYIINKDTYDLINNRFNYTYPYEKEINLKTKITVSELKKSRLADEENMDYEIYDKPVVMPYVPDFIEKKEEVTGSYKGTVYHKLLELLEMSKIKSVKDLNEQVKTLVNKGNLNNEEDKVIYRADIMKFIKSELCVRMCKAEIDGGLHREQPFVIGLKAGEIFPECASTETILVQGIIDLYFEEKGDIILADYKTDRVTCAEELVKKYSIQLDSYSRALEMMTGKKVKQKIIYSFYLNKEIIC